MRISVGLLTLFVAGGWASSARAIGVLIPEGSSVAIGRTYVWVKWDPDSRQEELIVAAAIATNTAEVGVIFATPSKPTRIEVADGFFVDLSRRCSLEPLPAFVHGRYRKLDRPSKYPRDADYEAVRALPAAAISEHVTLSAGDFETLSAWLRAHGLAGGPSEAELQALATSGWSLTVAMMDLRRLPGGENVAHAGMIGPLGVRFESESPIYPAHFDRGTASSRLDFRFYVHAPTKLDLPEPHGYIDGWLQRLRRASKEYRLRNEPFSVPFHRVLQAYDLLYPLSERRERMRRLRPGSPAHLLFGRWITPEDAADHLVASWYLAKIGKIFEAPDPAGALEFRRLDVTWIDDRSEHTFVLPLEAPFPKPR